MAVQRSCDVCGFYRQNKDGTSAVVRYGLSRQLPHACRTRRNGKSPAFTRKHSFGGIDLCRDCWERIAKPKTRPELLGKTNPSGRNQFAEATA